LILYTYSLYKVSVYLDIM